MFDPDFLNPLFFYCAVLGGGVMLLQLALTLLGMDDGGLGDVVDSAGIDLGDMDVDVDATTDSSGYWFFEMLSLRTLSAAAAFFGLAGKLSFASGLSPHVALLLALVAGYLSMYAVYWLFKQIFKMEVSGHQRIQKALGLVGQVYVPIDPGATGKVHLDMQNRTVEYAAVSDLAERLATGAKVVVTEIVSSDTVKVEPAD